MNYRHIFCECGGIIGIYNANEKFTCDKCGKEHNPREYDIIMINEKTGWRFPMKRRYSS